MQYFGEVTATGWVKVKNGPALLPGEIWSPAWIKIALPNKPVKLIYPIEVKLG